MNTIEKIIQLITNNKQIAQNLFLFSHFPDDVSLWTNSTRDGIDYKNIEWLFVTTHPNLTLVGVNIQDNTIWCIDNEGDFHQACDALENFPYEIIRGDCSYTENETVSEYFEKYKEEGYQETLQKYEQWCENNDIKLDKNKIYHDNNGNLFTHYFDKS